MRTITGKKKTEGHNKAGFVFMPLVADQDTLSKLCDQFFPEDQRPSTKFCFVGNESFLILVNKVPCEC